jgi:hypothetical protein
MVHHDRTFSDSGARWRPARRIPAATLLPSLPAFVA